MLHVEIAVGRDFTAIFKKWCTHKGGCSHCHGSASKPSYFVRCHPWFASLSSPGYKEAKNLLWATYSFSCSHSSQTWMHVNILTLEIGLYIGPPLLKNTQARTSLCTNVSIIHERDSTHKRCLTASWKNTVRPSTAWIWMLLSAWLYLCLNGYESSEGSFVRLAAV